MEAAGFKVSAGCRVDPIDTVADARGHAPIIGAPYGTGNGSRAI